MHREREREKREKEEEDGARLSSPVRSVDSGGRVRIASAGRVIRVGIIRRTKLGIGTDAVLDIQEAGGTPPRRSDLARGVIFEAVIKREYTPLRRLRFFFFPPALVRRLTLTVGSAGSFFVGVIGRWLSRVGIAERDARVTGEILFVRLILVCVFFRNVTGARVCIFFSFIYKELRLPAGFFFVLRIP